ncbi:MAG: GAF domain-containing SpoIIE family protein phosphatase [Bacteroidota bacterium]
MLILAFQMAEHVAAQFPVAQMVVGIDELWYRFALVAFFAVNTLLISRIFSNIRKLHVTTLLWRLFLIGMIGVTFIMIITFANKASAKLITYPYLKAIYYTIGLYAILIYFLSALFIYRRFILYPRTRRKLYAWRVFMGLVLFSLALTFFANTPGIVILVLGCYAIYIIVSLVISANVRWISYLNFNQKLRALGLSVMMLIVDITYIIAAVRLPAQMGMELDVTLIFLNFIVIFSLIYTTFSILVLFFNLPTSSIFERQGVEMASFSKINQAIQSNLDFTEIMNTLLDVTMMSSNAKAGWVENIIEETHTAEITICKKITKQDIEEIFQHGSLTEKIVQDQRALYIRNLKKYKGLRSSSGRFRSMLVVPIVSSSQTYGALYLVNELENGFEEVGLESARKYAEQAGIALENASLLKNSIEVERYQEQLKIATEVQSKLLPSQMPYSDSIDFAAKYDNAYEVGGDYFDIAQPSEDMFRVAIGDVSGKGTTAAFYMAEVKGIFHALSQLDLSVKEFILAANKAVSACLQKGFFVTLTYLEVKLKKRKIEFIRAGHCPAFFYNKEEDRICRFKEGTLGLGINRTDKFANFINKTENLAYSPGDVLALYTDGIIEARNREKEEYGYDRFEEILLQNKDRSAEEIAESIVSSVKSFVHGELQDDYTVLILKFK